MSKRDLLLEIGLEEMPARFVTASMKQLSDKVQKWLKEKAIEFGEVEALFHTKTFGHIGERRGRITKGYRRRSKRTG